MNFNLKILFITLSIFTFNSVFSQKLNSDGFFKSDLKATIIKNNPIPLDDNNDLIIIPEGRMFRKYFESIGYFKEVMNYKEFETYVSKMNQDLFRNAKTVEEVFKIIYEQHRKFLTMSMVTNKKNHSVDFILNKPDESDIFIVRGDTKTNLIGVAAGTESTGSSTYNAMMNEIINYIKTNSTTRQ